jgi:hypothetical protein
MPSVPKSTFYYVKDCQHAKNEVFYVSKSGENVLDRVMQGMTHESLKKVIQFALFSTYSKKGKPMFAYESMKGLLHFLQVKKFLQKHWCDNVGWSMAEIMHDIVKVITTKVMEITNYIQFLVMK